MRLALTADTFVEWLALRLRLVPTPAAEAWGGMAVSGVLIARGRGSLSGRGKWWLLAGLAVPAGFVVALRYL